MVFPFVITFCLGNLIKRKAVCVQLLSCLVSCLWLSVAHISKFPNWVPGQAVLHSRARARPPCNRLPGWANSTESESAAAA